MIKHADQLLTHATTTLQQGHFRASKHAQNRAKREIIKDQTNNLKASMNSQSKFRNIKQGLNNKNMMPTRIVKANKHIRKPSDRPC